MTLSVRPMPYVVPTYSLTGDLLAYLTCGLQYRYYNRGALPPSKPVQRWFGQFIHGVMEEAYRVWLTNRAEFPWSDVEIQPIAEVVVRRLAAKGIVFQTYLLLGIALERAHVILNTWAPHLFPLIAECEVHLQGIRQIPAEAHTIRQSHYYEVGGVADVITSVQLGSAHATNPIVKAISDSGLATDPYEVIVDYKGMRRPAISDPEDKTWLHHEWQVMTYAWLRNEQVGEVRVKTGVLLYLNELVPSAEDMDSLYSELVEHKAETDLGADANDLTAVKSWREQRAAWTETQQAWVVEVQEWWRGTRAEGQPFPRMPQMQPALSADYRLRRSLRVIPVVPTAVSNSLSNFDAVVGAIEESVWQETTSGRLTQSWEPRPRDETCTACDAKTFCPAKGNKYRGAPLAP